MVEPLVIGQQDILQLLPEFGALAIVLLVIGAEAIHSIRVRRIAGLAFGPRERPSAWARLAPALSVIASGLLVWGLLTLILLEPKTHNTVEIETDKKRHVVILLDVSPSMRLVDAGPEGGQSRMQRASTVLQSLFDRVPIRQYKLSVIAFYDDAIPVVIDTDDIEVVKNALNDLPMHFAFKGKETDLFAGLKKANEIVKPWQPDSTILIIVSDGDTVPPSGMPKMPKSVADVLVIGIGDPVSGKFIAGHQSKQDVSTLRQVATRLKGEFHNGNASHIPTTMIKRITKQSAKTRWEDLTRREYALGCVALGAIILSMTPLLLHYFGTRYYVGTPKPLHSREPDPAQTGGH